MINALIFCPILLFFLGACTSASAQQRTVFVSIPQLPTAQVAVAPTGTFEEALTPTTVIEPIITETSEALPTEEECALAEKVTSAYSHNTVFAKIHYRKKSLTVEQTIQFSNPTDKHLNDIVLGVEANNWPGAFSLAGVTVDVSQPDYTLEQNRLRLLLPSPLAPGCEVTLNLRFDLIVPEVGGGLASLRGYLGYSERQLNLSHWLPVVAPYITDAWFVPAPGAFGEQVALEQADWDLTIEVEDAPDSLKLAAPGQVEFLDQGVWRIIHRRSRDFAISLSEFFNVRQLSVSSGVVVELYSFPDTLVQGVFDSATHTIETAARSLELYEELFGSYPYRRMVIVQGDFADGMEFSGLVFVSTAWFYNFDGSSANYLTLITAHEVAHQWWYARVGNDSAQNPWMDEALATYSEYLYIERFFPELADWWWNFRVATYSPAGKVDSAVYEFETLRAYIDAVYLRGVQMLHQIRETIGIEPFLSLLKRYVEAADGQIATPELFWSLLTPEQFEQTASIRGIFLKNSDPTGGKRKDLSLP